MSMFTLSIFPIANGDNIYREVLGVENKGKQRAKLNTEFRKSKILLFFLVEWHTARISKQFCFQN